MKISWLIFLGLVALICFQIGYRAGCESGYEAAQVKFLVGKWAPVPRPR